jgi:hypothetical protein
MDCEVTGSIEFLKSRVTHPRSSKALDHIKCQDLKRFNMHLSFGSLDMIHASLNYKVGVFSHVIGQEL